MLSPKEVSETLSLREFLRLCATVDIERPTTQMAFRHGSGTDTQTTAGGKVFRRFDVLQIEREDKKLYVTISLDTENLRCEVIA